MSELMSHCEESSEFGGSGLFVCSLPVAESELLVCLSAVCRGVSSDAEDGLPEGFELAPPVSAFIRELKDDF